MCNKALDPIIHGLYLDVNLYLEVVFNTSLTVILKVVAD
jgi:hypothetical protein